MAKNKNNNKLTREEKEHIDNQVVLATSIGLISAIFLLYLYRYMNSSYITQTYIFTEILIYICAAGVLAGTVLYYIKRDKKFIKPVPYLAGIGAALSIIRFHAKFAIALRAIKVAQLWGWFCGLFGKHPTTVMTAYIFVYFCIFVYLVATYIYFGRMLKHGKRKK